MTMQVFMFPGQGSQGIGMGGQLFDEFAEITHTANEILGYSIKELCLTDSKQQLNQTQFTQPAIYTVNALTYYKKLKDNPIKPDYVAGHSLGEYNALLAAEVFNFAEGLQLVKKRSELMAEAKGGAMAAVLGVKSDEILKILNENALSQVTIANYNSYSQNVLSGLKKDIEQAQQLFKQIKNASFIPLKVSGAFHSSYMLEAQQKFSDYIKDFKFAIPICPVISNFQALPYHPAILQNNLINQLSQSVKWTSIIEYLFSQGEVVFEEIGPGKVLTGLLNKIKNNQ